MGSWTQILAQFTALPDDKKNAFLVDGLAKALTTIGQLRGDASVEPSKARHVLLYSSAFLQKPNVPPEALSLRHEDLNGFMACIYGMDWDRGLTLILHTPGGDPNAAAAVIDYLRQKFDDVEVIVPVIAMSAGTMMALGSDRIIMGRQSQLGPIDPQLVRAGRSMSAAAVDEQFAEAQKAIKADPTLAHLWAPVLAQVGPSLLIEARNALDYSETMVAGWLTAWMKAKDGTQDPATTGVAIAKHFNDARSHKSHGRRINREEAAAVGVVTEQLEDSDQLQEAVLTAYHLMTILFEGSLTAKMIFSDHGQTWLKNLNPPAGQAQPQKQPTPQPNRQQRRHPS